MTTSGSPTYCPSVPPALLHVTCGNIATADLLALVDQFHTDLATALESYNYVELDRPGVIVHDPN